MFDDVDAANKQINSMSSCFFKHSEISFGGFKSDRNSFTMVSRDEYKKSLQKSAWMLVFSKMDMSKYLTKQLKEEINSFVERQTKVPFTMRNVYKMLEIVVGTNSSRMDRALVSVFEKVTSHYHDNRYNLEGWKTNSSYIVNKKIILPYIAECNINSSTYVGIRYSHSNTEIIDDLVKALCYLTGTRYDNSMDLYNFRNGTPRELEWYMNNEELKNKWSLQYTHFLRQHGEANVPRETYIQDQLIRCFKEKRNNELPMFGQWYDWTFFRIKAFKKGTMHFEFKDKAVWELFNRRVAEIKGHPLPEKI
jgi:hypothetical protein